MKKNVSAYACCDLHENTFLQGDMCPVCEDDMRQYAREMFEANYWHNSDLIYEDQALIHEGNVYWLLIEQHPIGEYRYLLFQVPDSCRESGVPY